MKNNIDYPNLYNHIYDLVHTGLLVDIHQLYHTLMALLQKLGLEISTSKLIEPTKVAICLEIISVERTLINAR